MTLYSNTVVQHQLLLQNKQQTLPRQLCLGSTRTNAAATNVTFTMTLSLTRDPRHQPAQWALAPQKRARSPRHTQFARPRPRQRRARLSQRAIPLGPPKGRGQTLRHGPQWVGPSALCVLWFPRAVVLAEELRALERGPRGGLGDVGPRGFQPQP